LQSNNLEIPPIVKVKTLQFFLPETTSKLWSWKQERKGNNKWKIKSKRWENEDFVSQWQNMKTKNKQIYRQGPPPCRLTPPPLSCSKLGLKKYLRCLYLKLNFYLFQKIASSKDCGRPFTVDSKRASSKLPNV
jgi:hypothetical protein